MQKKKTVFYNFFLNSLNQPICSPLATRTSVGSINTSVFSFSLIFFLFFFSPYISYLLRDIRDQKGGCLLFILLHCTSWKSWIVKASSGCLSVIIFDGFFSNSFHQIFIASCSDLRKRVIIIHPMLFCSL